MKLYVPAESKKALNSRLHDGETIWGENFSLGYHAGLYPLNSTLPRGTVIVIYSKVINNSPYAQSYGTWNGKKVL